MSAVTSEDRSSEIDHDRENGARLHRVPVPVVRVLGAVARHVGMIVAFSVPAIVLWWHAWDGHLGNTLACSCGDSGQEVWFIAWPEYAITHGQNPFFSHLLYSAQGVNLLASTSSLLMGLVVAPITYLAGPIVATNVALTLAPALSAWAGWIACRRLSGWASGAVVGGLLFGYSPFVVDNVATGHVQLALLVVPPLALVVAYQLAVTQRGSPWLWGIGLGVLMWLQFMISAEVLAMMALVAGIGALVWAAMSWRSVLAKLPFALRGVGCAALTGGVLIAYPAWYVLAGPRHINGSPWPGIQVAGIRIFDLWNPGLYSAAANQLTRVGGYEGLQGPTGTYLGIGILALAGLSLVVTWRRRLSWWLIAMCSVTLVLAAGIFFWTSPTHVLDVPWLPWQTIGNLPLFDQVAPQRLMLFVDLFCAVLISVGLGTLSTRLQHAGVARTAASRAWVAFGLATAVVAVAVAVVSSVWPTYEVPLRTESVSVPAWYQTQGRTVAAGSVLLSYPFPLSTTAMPQAMVWQAIDGMRFSLAGGYLKVPGLGGKALAEGTPGSAFNTLANLTQASGPPLPKGTAGQIAALRAALVQWRVSDIVIVNRGQAPMYAAALFTAVMGRSPAISHGAWVWHLGPTPTATARSTARSSAAALHACIPTPGLGRAPTNARLPLRQVHCVLSHL